MCVCFFVAVCPRMQQLDRVYSTFVCLCFDSTSIQLIMHLLRKCCQIMLTPQPVGEVGVQMAKRRWVCGNGMYVCIMHMSHFPAFPTTAHAKSKNSGMQPMQGCVSKLICIMCAIRTKQKKKSKLLFILEPFALRWLAYQSHGDDMEESSSIRTDRTGLDWTRGIIACTCLRSTG